MKAHRRIGDILVEDFAWDRGQIERIAGRHSSDGRTRVRLGAKLRAEVATDRERADVAIALALQLSERHSATQSVAFDAMEYLEIGRILRHDRMVMAQKVRAYGLVLVGLILYIAYPLNFDLGQVAHTGRPPGLLRLYAGVGLLLAMVALVLGDGLIKSYAYFIKRRWRMSMARRQLRAQAIARSGAVPTVMPSREADVKSRQAIDIAERPDPEMSGVQHMLPIVYTVGAYAKLALMAFFIACLMKASFQFDGKTMYKASAIVLGLGGVWYHYAGLMCERYHKTMLEAAAITVETPYPRATTRHFQDGRRREDGAKWMLGYVGLSLVALTLGSAVVWWAGDHHAAYFCALAFVSVAHLVIRVGHVSYRTRQMKVVAIERKSGH